jgi:hypothetical protein
LALTSDDSKVRDAALYELFGNIFHQGTRYQASPYAIPFLYDLLEDSSVQEKEYIVVLLVSLGVGYSEDYVPDGFPIVNFRNYVAETEKNLSEEDRKYCEAYGAGPHYDLACYDAVLRRLPTLMRLTEEDEAELRRAAVFALAWFPESAKDSIDAVTKVLQNRTEAQDAIHALLSLSLLKNSKSGSDINLPDLSTYMSPEHNVAVHVAAAIALADKSLSAELIEVLLLASVCREEIELVTGKNRKDRLNHHEGDLCGYASRVLLAAEAENYPRIVKALASSLEHIKMRTRRLLPLVPCST